MRDFPGYQGPEFTSASVDNDRTLPAIAFLDACRIYAARMRDSGYGKKFTKQIMCQYVTEALTQVYPSRWELPQKN